MFDSPGVGGGWGSMPTIWDQKHHVCDNLACNLTQFVPNSSNLTTHRSMFKTEMPWFKDMFDSTGGWMGGGDRWQPFKIKNITFATIWHRIWHVPYRIRRIRKPLSRFSNSNFTRFVQILRPIFVPVWRELNIVWGPKSHISTNLVSDLPLSVKFRDFSIKLHLPPQNGSQIACTAAGNDFKNHQKMTFYRD